MTAAADPGIQEGAAPAAPSRPFVRRGARARARWRAASPWVYLAPTLLLLGVFVYWPFVHTFWLSLVQWNLNPTQGAEFVGAANYGRVASATLFEHALWNTLIYVAAAIPLKVLLPIPLALFVWSLGSRGHVYRAILFLPTLLSFVVIAIAFIWILNPLFGYAKQWLGMLGLGLPPLLTHPDFAIWTIVSIASWKVMGFNMLLYLAGLASINREYIEAMRMDGAGDGAIFRRLILPLLTPTMFFVLISTVIFTIQQVFTPIDILTGGGPENSTTNLFYMVYQYTFLTFDVGAGAAGTVILFALLMIVTVAQILTLDRRVEYRQ
ncbi:MAG: carbohydrate ABC transporter permease [Albimonas sp.]|uniref:carbohydrate ABC transporter permease n=1 Tax=Albimonas sp. TaxID=1872425 RepID=UPI0040566B20|tara:strand:+ start:2401 stop:3369 length:969 start_codon:yes stop_codon:yes gene_type:complete